MTTAFMKAMRQGEELFEAKLAELGDPDAALDACFAEALEADARADLESERLRRERELEHERRLAEQRQKSDELRAKLAEARATLEAARQRDEARARRRADPDVAALRAVLDRFSDEGAELDPELRNHIRLAGAALEFTLAKKLDDRLARKFGEPTDEEEPGRKLELVTSPGQTGDQGETT